MTVAQLRTILSALPPDCDDLPVKLHAAANELHCNLVLINPPNNWYGAEVGVLLTCTSDLPPGEEYQALTLPRHS